MTSDLTPAIFGLVGAAVGGIGTSLASLYAERVGFKRERAAAGESERRNFRIDALVRAEEALRGLYSATYIMGTLRRNNQPFTTEVAADADRWHGEAVRWAGRVQAADVRDAIDAAILAALDYGVQAGAEPDDGLGPAAVDALLKAQTALNVALRALYD